MPKGVYFASDAAFEGLKRELTAQDFVYSYMRCLDPANRSAYARLLQGTLVGHDTLAEEAKRSGHFSYVAKIAGPEAVDRYAIRFRLNRTDYNFPYIVARTAHTPSGDSGR